MVKFIIFLSIFISSIFARENPFFSTSDDVMPLTSNIEMRLEPLKRATITLPSTARTIQSVTIKYKNLDGSEESKSINLNNSIDWHLPIFISQSYAKVTPRKNPSSSSKTLKRASSYKKILAHKSISFYENKRTLKIFTPNKLLRNFMLVNPHRVVMDFKSNDAMKALSKKTRIKSIYKKIRIGNHKGYYRVVIELDGPYTYKLNSIKNGYIIKLY